jgi:hypothetical protein
MRLLLPMDGRDEEESKLTKLDDVKVWCQLNIEDGEVKETLFADTKEEFSEYSECIVVVNDNEYVWPFMELSMLVLVAHTQRYIEDIVEAYIFKELHELAY